MRILADIGSVMRFLEYRKRNKYPDALVFGVSFVGQLILAFSKENYPCDYTPASIVSQNMLNKTMPNNFELAIEYRHNDETGSFDVDPEEIQGYVDSIALYIASCFARENNVPEMLMADTLDLLPQFTHLSVQVQASCSKFIMENADWAAEELLPNDLDDGRSFMSRVVTRVEGGMSSQPYRRGSRTARDTLLLYVDVVQAFLAGLVS